MKIKAKKSDIKDVISTAGSIAAIGAQGLLITTSLLVDAKDGKATFTGTNLDQTVKAIIPCDVIAEGRATIPAQFLARIVGASDTDDVVIDAPDTNDECGHISVGDSNYSFSVFKVSDFPDTVAEDGEEYVVKTDALLDAIKNTKYAISPDQTRRALMAILFEFRGDTLTCVATDGRRLSAKECAVTPKGGAKDIDVLIPPVGVATIQKMIAGRDGEVTFKVSAKSASVIGSTWDIHTKVIDEKYPSWRQVMPASFDHEVKVSRVALMSKIAQVMVACPKDSPTMSMKFSDKVLSLYMSDRSGTDAKTTLPVDFCNSVPIEVMLNPCYLYAILTNATDDNMAFLFANGSRPVGVRGDGLTCVIMPIRGA